jgi:Dockerin type I domain/PEP-CTERM motif
MRISTRHGRTCRSLFAVAAASALARPVAAMTLRIVTYNISGDTTTFDSASGVPPSGPLSTVMQALGAETLAGDAQPIDVLGLEELNNTPSNTEQAIVNSLNSLYGAGTYAFSNQVDLTDSTTAGSGPSGLIYNTKTVQIVSSTALGTVSGSGPGRQPLRFLLQPVGYGSNADFYMYVDHAKADQGASDATRRTIEADEVRQDADGLPANSHIIFTGDWNLAGSTNGTTTSGSAEGAYKDLTAAPGTTLASGTKAGSEQVNDPVATSFQADSSAASNIKLYTESATTLSARFDLQLDSPAVVPANNQPGLQLVPDTYMSFGNSYYVGNTLSTTETLNGNVSVNNTGPLTDLSNRSAVLTALTQLTDHLPVVADYNIVGINPLPVVWNGGTGNWSTATQWSFGTVPNSSTVEVEIDNGNPTASVVTLDQSETVQDLTLDSNDTLNISSAKTLTIDGPNGSVLTGIVNNSGTLAVTGGTTQLLSNSTLGGTYTVSSGAILKINGTLGLTTLTSNGTTLFAANTGTGVLSRAFSSISIGSGGAVTVAAATQTAGPVVNPNRSVLVTPALTVATTGTLNLNNNDMIVQGVGATGLTAITAQIAQGRNTGAGGLWNGTGITSSSAAVTANNTALAVELNNDDNGNALVSSFDGTPVTSSDVLVKYTFNGDANMDGVVNGDDYTLIDNGFNTQATGWRNGDFNYDGVINGDDYLLIDNTFNFEGSVSYATTGAQPTEMIANNTSSVPEPTTVAMLLVGSAGLLARRRRR